MKISGHWLLADLDEEVDKAAALERAVDESELLDVLVGVHEAAQVLQCTLIQLQLNQSHLFQFLPLTESFDDFWKVSIVNLAILNEDMIYQFLFEIVHVGG